MAEPDFDLVSSDVFDTVLLRDATTETQRFYEAARLAALRLGVPSGSLVRMRWEAQAAAYRAVAMERPGGEASLAVMCASTSAACGFGDRGAQILHDAELEVDARHLRPNRALVEVYRRARARGQRIVAVSDTYYSQADVELLLHGALGPGDVPFDIVYSSCDVGLTKHSGELFGFVSRAEGVRAARVIHIGDHPGADVTRAAAAGWSTFHLPRERSFLPRKVIGRLRVAVRSIQRVR